MLPKRNDYAQIDSFKINSGIYIFLLNYAVIAHQ